MADSTLYNREKICKILSTRDKTAREETQEIILGMQL